MINVGLGIIVKNEEDLIESFHEHVRGKFEEIVYVDGVSDDTTYLKLLNYQKQGECQVFQRDMNFDFGSQRNFVIEQMKSPWIFMLDVDERMNPALTEIVTQNFNGGEHDAFHIRRAEFIDETLLAISLQIRLYRNKEKIRYVRRLHERPNGYKNLGKLDEWRIIVHKKSTARQHKQNIFYSKNWIEQREGI